MNEPIVEVIGLAQGEFVKNGATVRTELGNGLPPIQGDRVHLQQVILNLVIKAVQAMNDVRIATVNYMSPSASSNRETASASPCGTPARAERGQRRSSVSTILHDQARRHGNGSIDLPVDHRRPPQTAVGESDRAPRCFVSVFDPSYSAGHLTIRSVSLFGTNRRLEDVCSARTATTTRKTVLPRKGQNT